ncbi:MAG TPA: catalase family protein [Labilithrix sp.]|nr:catalase family protein [Labilithrix sp.]
MKPLRLSALALCIGPVVLAACSSPADPEVASDDAALSIDARLGEVREPNEAALVKGVAEAATSQLSQAREESADKVARRDAHPKAHGCVTGSFAVNADVPEDMRVGTFQPGKRYDAWVRFSNGSQKDDRKDDARGMAIKLLGVEGERLLTGEEPTAHTHDLVLTNHHTFFITNVADYVKFMQTVTEKGNPLSFFFSLNVFDLHLREAWLARQFTTQPISSPLTSRYFSATPYKLGSQAVKYAVTPCKGADTSGNHEDEDNYLGAALKKGLATSAACFDFMIQRRAIPDDMPIEDSTITWEEADSAFVPVGRLTIPAQTFDSPEQKKHCENLSFSPWHGTTPHRPLGSMNRTRKVVYEATSKLRHKLNGAPRVEPTSLDVPGATSAP